MSFPATVFNVLIASPSDVPQERQAIAECLHSWNALHAKDSGKVLLPVMWESHSAPSMADRPQGVINDQLVRSCDMLIGVFWTRLGSPTGVAKSGTVEEINWFLKQKKPVMLYFSNANIPPDFDVGQWNELKAFKEKLLSKGLLEQYGSVEELSQKLMRQMTIVLREVNVTSVVDAKAVQRAIQSSEANDAQSTTATPLRMDEYTVKSFIVVGNSTPWKEQLKANGGSWIKTKRGISAWCFSKKKLATVAAILGVEAVLHPAPEGDGL